jgi:short-subunit dehydrogenase
MELSDSRVLVTGASRGIGEELARQFAAAGASVALVARSAEPLEKLAADLGGFAYPCDLTDAAQVEGLLARIETDGPVDVVVNNAAFEQAGPFADVSAAALAAQNYLNLVVPMELCRQAIPGMRARGRGHVVNMSSLAGLVATPGLTSYCGTKAGLSHFTAALRAELRGEPIGTTLVELGLVDTDMAAAGRTYGPTDRALARLQRLGLLPGADIAVADVAAAIVRAVERDERHVILPRRAVPITALVELPRRLAELALTGVDPHRP